MTAATGKTRETPAGRTARDDGVLWRARVAVFSAWLMLKILMRSRVTFVAALVQPVVVAVVVAENYEAGRGTLTLANLMGAAVVGAWASVLFFAGGQLLRERRQGTLEVLVSTPAPLAAVTGGKSLAAAFLSVYSLVAVVLVATIGYGVPFDVASPVAFALAVVVMVAGLAVMGLLVSALFVVHRQAAMFQNMLEYPVWLLCGLLVPFASLAPPLRVLGAVLLPTWVTQSLSDALSGEPATTPLLLGVAVAAVYLVAGRWLLVVAERRATVDATLPLA
jgi:ABC-2 type transport system permease protein